jgi:hypothetical protein
VHATPLAAVWQATAYAQTFDATRSWLFANNSMILIVELTVLATAIPRSGSDLL